MYSPVTVSRNLERIVQAGYPRPIEHAQVDSWIARLDAIRTYDESSDSWVMLRPYNPEEQWFIRNEILLCRLDFRYWVARYCWILSAEDKRREGSSTSIVRFQPWKSQEIFLDIVSEMEEAGIAIVIQLLKARQLGMSRIVSLMILHRLIFYGDVNAIMASSRPDKSHLLATMLKFTLSRLPYWMKPGVVKEREGSTTGLLEFDNGSGVTIQHGAQTSGIARGTTPRIFHLTELAEYIDAKSIVDSALMRAFHDRPDALGVLEGTAEGENNWWHDKWLSSKSGWPEGRSRFRPLFLPWFVGGLYPTETWLRARPIPADWRPAPWALKHREVAEAYVRLTPYLAKRLGSDWRMTVEQLWFYEVEREQAIRERRLPQFLQEMPANDDEAFQHTGISVFDTETVTYYTDTALQQPVVGIYKLAGPLQYLPARFQPHAVEIDPNQPRLPIRYGFHQGYPIDFELVPIRWEGWSLDDGQNKIYLWERPRTGETYGIGLDTSKGVGEDSTCIEVLRKGTPWSSAKQVAEFASNSIGAMEAIPFAMALGALFSTSDPQEPAATFLRQPRLAIECKGEGDQTQLKMKLLGWSNFHPWQRVDNRMTDRSKFNKIGVYTNQWFRRALLEYFISMVRDRELVISSKWLVREMQNLAVDEITQAVSATYGGHDDRVMALGFALISLYQWDLPGGPDAQLKPKPPLMGGTWQPLATGNGKAGPPQFAQWRYSPLERPLEETDLYGDGILQEINVLRR